MHTHSMKEFVDFYRTRLQGKEKQEAQTFVNR